MEWTHNLYDCPVCGKKRSTGNHKACSKEMQRRKQAKQARRKPGTKEVA